MILSALSLVCPFIQQVLLAIVVIVIDWVLYNNAAKHNTWWQGLEGPDWTPEPKTMIVLCLLYVGFTLVACILGSYSKMGFLVIFGQFCQSACLLGMGICLFVRDSMFWAIACACILQVILLVELAWAAMRNKLIAFLLLYPVLFAAIALVMLGSTASRTDLSQLEHTEPAELAKGFLSSVVDIVKHPLAPPEVASLN